MCWCIHSWEQLSKGSRHLGNNFLFSSGARNTLALPLELEQNQFLIDFKIWNGTFLQSSMNRPYPEETEWISANHLPCELFFWGPYRTESTRCAVVSHQVIVLHDVAWAENSKREKNLQGEKSNAFTNMPWGWIDLQGWSYMPTFLQSIMISKKYRLFLQKRGSWTNRMFQWRTIKVF